MPPEVADALKKTGHWNPKEGAAPPAATWNTLDVARPGGATEPGKVPAAGRSGS
jgi:cytochrome c-type biogenesis protein CcmE